VLVEEDAVDRQGLREPPEQLVPQRLVRVALDEPGRVGERPEEGNRVEAELAGGVEEAAGRDVRGPEPPRDLVAAVDAKPSSKSRAPVVKGVNVLVSWQTPPTASRIAPYARYVLVKTGRYPSIGDR
jgi:hypothetical protein